MKDLITNLFPEIEATRPMIISGPCSAETEGQVLSTAKMLAEAGVKIFRAGIWKPRTKPGGFEGIGKEGLAWLRRVKQETGMLTATEVATAEHVYQALKGGVDLLWVGARTTANPFAVQEVADALRGVDIPVLVKNPVSPDLELWIGGMERIYNSGVRRIGAIHRGFSTYDKTKYRNQPQWAIPMELRRRMPDLPIYCDPSHIGGARDLIQPISQQAMDLGFSGLIVETHCNPCEAWSDAAQQLTPADFAKMLSELVIRDAKVSTEDLSELRTQIDDLDCAMLELLSKRMRVSREIGLFKKEHNMPVLQTGRYEEILDRRSSEALSMDMETKFIKTILTAIHEESVQQQIKILNE